MNPKYSLINSAERMKTHPATWGHPTAKDFDCLTEGIYVKIGVESTTERRDVPTNYGERFWAKVTSVDHDNKTAVVVVEQGDMVLYEYHGVNHADTLTIAFDNIMDIMDIGD